MMPLPALRIRYGGSVSHVLSDPKCGLFSTPGIDGVIPYRRGFGALVAIGDPVCNPRDAAALAEAFRRYCHQRKLHTVIACASEEFALQCVQEGYSAAEFGEEAILDPRRDPQVGAHGREVRKKVAHARRDGVVARELLLERDDDTIIARDIVDTGQAWLAKRGLGQPSIAPLFFFNEPDGRRWFYAQRGDRVVGALSIVRLDRFGGFLFEHLVFRPDAPHGTTELLVTTALSALRSENCAFATFGPATLPRLGALYRVGRYSRFVARLVFRGAAWLTRFDMLAQYRRKFQPVMVRPSYLLFSPPRFGLAQATGLLRAFNFT